MLFNSIDFAFFLPLCFSIYWLIGSKKLGWQNAFLLLASYVFYGWWDWRFLLLIFISSCVDFGIGLQLKQREDESHRKILLGISLLVNLGLLGFFKYYNFFVESFVGAFTFFGQPIQGSTLNIILPVGISFYTFQTLSYSIDIYRKKLEPSQNIISFLAFVSFFPQLVAGPIERASNLLPQFLKRRTFSESAAIDGSKQILWGLFKKVVIADSCGVVVDAIFTNYETMGGIGLLVGAILFAFQIYGDFSGYSDIAIGTAKLFGFTLMQNFAFPYFSRDIAEFWRRWHISLSTWFRDYLYIPLGGSRVGQLVRVRNTFAIFLVSGFWHGANWTFVVWGALNAIYFLPLLLLKQNRKNLGTVAEGKMLPQPREVVAILSTFFITCLAWVFFRAESVQSAFGYLYQMATHMSYVSMDQFRLITIGIKDLASIFSLIGLMLVMEWINREGKYGIEKLSLPKWGRYPVYYFLMFLVLAYFNTNRSFIYFQF